MRRRCEGLIIVLVVLFVVESIGVVVVVGVLLVLFVVVLICNGGPGFRVERAGEGERSRRSVGGGGLPVPASGKESTSGGNRVSLMPHNLPCIHA